MAISDRLLDELLSDYENPEDLLGEGGLLKELTRRLVERAMEAEMTTHLGYEKNEKTLVKKKKEGWVFEDDPGFKIDQEKASTMFVDFIMARAASYETESAEDLEPFGLHRPMARITLSGLDRSETILFGDPSKKAKNRIYAKMLAKPQVVTVNQSLLDDLPKDKADIKEKEKEEQKDQESDVKKSD